MTHIPFLNIIEDDVGRFDAPERAAMRRLGFEIIPATSHSIVDVTEQARRLSERIVQVDGMRSPAVLQQMTTQRSQLTMQLPEIGF